jgi:hypothetical protein
MPIRRAHRLSAARFRKPVFWSMLDTRTLIVSTLANSVQAISA